MGGETHCRSTAGFRIVNVAVVPLTLVVVVDYDDDEVSSDEVDVVVVVMRCL